MQGWPRRPWTTVWAQWNVDPLQLTEVRSVVGSDAADPRHHDALRENRDHAGPRDVVALGVQHHGRAVCSNAGRDRSAYTRRTSHRTGYSRI